MQFYFDGCALSFSGDLQPVVILVCTCVRILFFLWFPTRKSELISFNFSKNSLKVTKLFVLMPVYSRYWMPILKFHSLRRLNSSSHALPNETRWYSNGNERVKSFNTNLPEEVRMLNCETHFLGLSKGKSQKKKKRVGRWEKRGF